MLDWLAMLRFFELHFSFTLLSPAWAGRTSLAAGYHSTLSRSEVPLIMGGLLHDWSGSPWGRSTFSCCGGGGIPPQWTQSDVDNGSLDSSELTGLSRLSQAKGKQGVHRLTHQEFQGHVSCQQIQSLLELSLKGTYIMYLCLEYLYARVLWHIRYTRYLITTTTHTEFLRMVFLVA